MKKPQLSNNAHARLRTPASGRWYLSAAGLILLAICQSHAECAFAEITRLRSLGRHNEAEMLAGVLREVMVANQPVSDSPQQDKGGWFQADEPHHHIRPETAYERICSLQKQIEKVASTPSCCTQRDEGTV